VVFADNAGRVHARRWTNRQGGYSAVRDTTTAVLIVAEAMHGAASADVQILTVTVANELNVIWSITPTTTILSQSSPRFEFEKRPPPRSQQHGLLPAAVLSTREPIQPHLLFGTGFSTSVIRSVSGGPYFPI